MTVKRSRYDETLNEGGEGYQRDRPSESGEPLWSILEGNFSRLRAKLNFTPLDSAEALALDKQVEDARSAYLTEYNRVFKK
jgi:hypothetical protein